MPKHRQSRDSLKLLMVLGTGDVLSAQAVVRYVLSLVIAVWFVLPVFPQAPGSAWEEIVRHRPQWARTVAPWEKEVLQLMTSTQVRAYAAGSPATEIVLTSGQTLAGFLEEKGVVGFAVSWASVDGGGGVSTGGLYQMTATIGQVDAGVMTNGVFSLRGGFLASERTPVEVPIFSDGFESGDLNAWSISVGGP